MRLNIVDPYLPKLASIEKKIHKSLKSGLVTNNSRNLVLFEKELKKFFKSKYVPVVFCNGEMALYSLIYAWKTKLGFKLNQKIKALVPSFTFVGTINALYLNNIEPVFCDIDETLTLDLKSIKKIDKSIKLILPVSVYGNIIDIHKVKKFCRKNKINCIVDSAPAFGSKFNGKYINNLGIDEIYSFHVTKIFNSIEGGVAITNNKSIHKTLKNLRNFGQSEKQTGDVLVPGLNSKMQEFSAIIGLENLKRINRKIEKRRKVIKQYNEFFKLLEKKNYLKLMKVRPDVECQYLYYPIILKNNRERFLKYLKKNKIFGRKYYTSVKDLTFYKNKFKCFKEMRCECKHSCKDKNSLVNTEKIKNKIVALPLHTETSNKKFKHFFSTIKKYFNEK